jgi:hypothetical protein
MTGEIKLVENSVDRMQDQDQDTSSYSFTSKDRIKEKLVTIIL